MKVEEKYMQRCIQLARNGYTRTAPNPMVGAVLVCEDKIIGEGFHVRCGGPHAEVNAIASVRHPEKLSQSTLYVSLEPCSHYGKTPPCADLIIEKQIPRVVVGCVDPFARVSGSGIRKLREAGVEVIVGVCEKQCLELNKRFMTFHQLHRPFVTLKWAESVDHYIDNNRASLAERQPYRFSTPYTQAMAHKRRAEHQAVLVGTRTALLDNPSLNTRSWPGDSPLRLVIDRQGVLPADLHLFDEVQPVCVYTEHPGRAQYLGRPGVTYVLLEKEKPVVGQIMADLYNRNIQTLLVEGGSFLIRSFLDADCWDEGVVECTSDRLGSGVEAPRWPLETAWWEETECMGHKMLHFRHHQ